MLPVDNDLFLLTDSMGAIHGLEIVLRIPIRIIDNYNIGRHQVDAQTASFSRQHENEFLTSRSIVRVNSLCSIRVGCVSV